MKVKALTNLKCESGWHFVGETFEIRAEALEELKGLVEKAEESASPKAPAQGTEGDPAANEHAGQEKKPQRTATRKRRE